MLKVAVIRDIKIERFLKQFGGKNDYNIDVKIFSDEDEMYDEIINGCEYDIIFLRESGEKIVKYIREVQKNERTAVVLLSYVNRISYTWIRLMLFDCIVIPYTYDILNECMERYIKIYDAAPDVFRFKRNGNVVKVNTDDIYFIVSEGRKVVLNTESETYEYYGRIADCKSEKCFRSFIRCHKSYFVNPKYISALNSSVELKLTNGKTIPISRSGYSENKNLFLKAENFSKT